MRTELSSPLCHAVPGGIKCDPLRLDGLLGLALQGWINEAQVIPAPWPRPNRKRWALGRLLAVLVFSSGRHCEWAVRPTVGDRHAWGTPL